MTKLNKLFSAQIEKGISILKQGGLVALPSRGHLLPYEEADGTSGAFIGGCVAAQCRIGSNQRNG